MIASAISGLLALAMIDVSALIFDNRLVPTSETPFATGGEQARAQASK